MQSDLQCATQHALNKLNVAVEDGTYRDVRPLTFNEWSTEWLAGLQRPKESTLKTYRIMVNRYARPAFGGVMMKKLDGSHVRRFLALMKESGAGPTTQGKHLRGLSQCLKSATRQGYAPRDVTKDLSPSERPQAEQRESAYFLPAEPAKIAAQLAEPYKQAFRLAVMTGLRLGELSGLEWQDVDLTAGVLHVRRTWTDGVIGTTKNRQNRQIDLSPDAIRLLGEWWGEQGNPLDTDPVFLTLNRHGVETYMHSATARAALYAAMTAADVPRACPEGKAKGELRGWHSTRHTYAKVCLESGRDLLWVSRSLGHSSLGITSETYGHYGNAASKVQAAALEGAFNV